MGDTAPAGTGTNTKKKTGNLFRVSPHMVIPSRVGGFSLYLKQDGKLVLYAEKGELFTEEHKKRLSKLDVGHLYAKAEHFREYTRYLHENLKELLDNDDIPMRERARAWSDASIALAKEAYDRSLPQSVDKRQFKMIAALIRNSLRFFINKGALKELSRFISEGSALYDHGVGVMVLTVSVLAKFVKNNSDLLVAVGMGAMLHDIGKLELPDSLFNRSFDRMSQEEQDLIKSHPALGVGICSTLPMPQETLQCILFHHEKEDGSGYPSGARGEMLPSYAKVLSLCNRYDNLIRGAGRQKRLTPFEALTKIKNERTAYDAEMLKMLIEVLSEAKLT